MAHLVRWFTVFKMLNFHSYVSLPEGISEITGESHFCSCFNHVNSFKFCVVNGWLHLDIIPSPNVDCHQYGSMWAPKMNGQCSICFPEFSIMGNPNCLAFLVMWAIDQETRPCSIFIRIYPAWLWLTFCELERSTMLFSWENIHDFDWAMTSIAMLVITRGYPTIMSFLVKIEGPYWYTIYHHRNLLLKRFVQTPLLINQPMGIRDIYGHFQ